VAELIQKRKANALARRIRKRRLEGLIYTTLGKLFFPFLSRQKTSPNHDPRNILILQAKQHIGDLVVAMPLIATLKSVYPKTQLSVLVPEELVSFAKCDQNVDEVIGYSRRLEKHPWGALILGNRMRQLDPDTVFVLGIHFFSNLIAFLSGSPIRVGYDYNGRGFLLRPALRPHTSCNKSGWEYGSRDQIPHIIEFWDQLLSLWGLSSLPPSWRGLDLKKPANSVREWMNYSLAGSRRPFIGVHTCARNPIRNWAPEKFSQLCEDISATYSGTIIFTGSEQDLPHIEVIRRHLSAETVISAGQLDILQSWALIRHLDLMISVDTAIIHLCAAVNVPVITLFGPGDPLIWGPYGFGELVIQRHEACQRCKGGRCVQDRLYCMESISVKDVMDLIAANERQLMRSFIGQQAAVQYRSMNLG
jgi:ADP-heptose:LPS heptosyltransferase